MKVKDYLINSLLIAVGVFIYSGVVAWFMFNGEKFFDGQDSFLMPLFMLILFIVSASLTGLMVLGKPVHLYMNELKKEALVLLFATILWLVFFLVILMTVLLLK